MKFRIDKEILAAVLKKASGTVSNKDAQPILKNFLIKVETGTGPADGRLRVASTDMSLGAIAEVGNVPVQEEGSVCAPAKKLVDMVDSAPAGNIFIALNGTEITIRSAYDDKDPANPKFRNEWLLHCTEAALYPEFPDFDPAQAVLCKREGLVTGLARTFFAAADDELKINLMCVYINDNRMYAADGHRACRIAYPSNLKDIMIPAPAVKMLVTLLKNNQDDDIKIYKSKFHLMFQVGKDLYHSRLLDATYPDIDGKVFKDTEAYAFTLKVKRDDLKAALARAAVTTEETNVLKVKMTGGQLSFETEDSQANYCHETFDWVEWNGVDFDRRINLVWLKQTIDVIASDDVVIRMGEDRGKQQTKYRFDDGSDFAAVIMPLRVRTDADGSKVRLNDRVKQRVEAAESKKDLEALVQ